MDASLIVTAISIRKMIVWSNGYERMSKAINMNLFAIFLSIICRVFYLLECIYIVLVWYCLRLTASIGRPSFKPRWDVKDSLDDKGGKSPDVAITLTTRP